jgi:autotransporter-associated beta strand protein
MKKNLLLPIAYSLLLGAAPLAATAQTTFFTDNFSNGSTTNQLSVPGGTPTASSTSYDLATSKNTTTCTIGPGLLRCRLSSATSSGYWEAQALFTTNAVGLGVAGDYIDIAIVFTNSQGTLLAAPGTIKDEIWIGLYNSGAAPGTINPPVAGVLTNAGLTTTAGSAFATGNCELWAGYACRVLNGAGSRIATRPVQNNGGTASSNQELLGNGVSGGAYNNPGGTAYTGTSQTYTLATSGAYTLDFRITLDPAGSGSLIFSNALFSGVGTGGALVFSNATTSTTVPIVALSFDGLAFGAFNSSSPSANPQMDVSSITISGQSTCVTFPPNITAQPQAVTVPSGASCAFQVAASSSSQITYQWHRNGTNLLNGGSISGTTSPLLVISPAGSADVANYYVTATISSCGNIYSTNSVTNSLTLGSAKSLIYSGSGPWDLNTSPSWQDAYNNTGLYFNFGDPVTFSDVGGGGSVQLTGSYLSAASVTVDHTSSYYTFWGSGSFAGPGNLIYTGSGLLTISNANTYTGGTLISNATANLRLGNVGGLGTGPVTLAEAGGQMEILVQSSSTAGIDSDFIVADDFTWLVDPVNTSYAVVLNGNVSGTAGKTLTINSVGGGTSALTRIRIYSNDNTNAVCNANLNLNDPTFLLACYQASGSQTYNGVISGAGALMEKGSTLYLNNTNTYSGGTTPAAGSIGLGTNSDATPDYGPIGTGPLLLAVDSTTTLNGSGTIFASGGPRTIANLIQYPTGSNNLTLIIGGTNNLTLSGAFSLQGQDGGGAGTNRTIQADNTGLSTLSGVISDGGLGVGLIKTGTNVLALNNAETYTGPTIISNGTLRVNGSLAAGSAVTVATNGTLGGTGTVGGNVTVNPGGALAPGDAIGTLTIGGNLTLAGNLAIEVNKSASPTSDKVVVSGTLNNTGTGTVTVTNLGPALAPGDTFTLFNKAVGNGSALSVSGANAIWTNKLATDGTIAVLSVTATTATNISYSVSGTNLTLSWPANYLTWTLQSNAVSVVAATNWFAVPNSSNVTSIVIPIYPSRTNVFYRLLRPF